ncbi:MAG: FAD-dependent oxidoreductase [Burkholderiaceae bacterium]
MVVVGAGVAGLETASVAAARGHDVTVFGASDQVGGKLRLHAALPGSDSLGNLYANQYPDALKAGVRFELGVRATVSDILACRPDAVVLATGSRMAWPSTLPGQWQQDGLVPDLRDSVASILDFKGADPGCVVIFDQDHTRGTYAAAELFRRHFARVVLVTPREMIAKDEPTVVRQRIYQRIYERRIDIVLLSELCPQSALEQGRVAFRNVYNGDRGEVANVSLLTYSGARVPNDAMLAPLSAAGVECHQVGDCYAPRGMLAATREGHRLANAL